MWCQREEIQKARVNCGSNYDSLKPLTDPHHMIIKCFRLHGLAAENRSRQRRRWCDKHCSRPSDVCNTEQLVSWQRLRRSAVDFYSKKTKNSLFQPPRRTNGQTDRQICDSNSVCYCCIKCSRTVKTVPSYSFFLYDGYHMMLAYCKWPGRPAPTMAIGTH